MAFARCGIWIVWLLASTPAFAQWGQAPDLQPKTYTSPSGEFTLSVNPSQRSGAGKANYELKKKGNVDWSGERPFTLWDCAVADDGTVGGYAYSSGYNGVGAGEGEFVVVIVDPIGGQKLAERTPREGSHYEHTMADPKANGLFLDSANDRLVVRVSDPDVNTTAESWWTYRLSNGEVLGKPKPKELMPDHERTRWVIDARPVAGTPLALIQWWRFESDGPLSRWKYGARFTLVDLACAPVWTLELPEDYTIRGNEDAADKLHAEVREHGAILGTSQPSRFELRHVAAGKRVTYAVEKDAASPGAWRVREVATMAFVEAKSEKTTSASAPANSEIALRKLGSIELGRLGASAGSSPVHDVADFAIDDRGRFALVRRAKSADEFEVSFSIIDGDGKLVRSVTLPKTPKDQAFAYHAAWIAGDRWIVTTSQYGQETKSTAAWIDVATGTLTPIERFDCPYVESVVSTRDGGFVALTKQRFKYTSEDALLAFDAAGRTRWKVGSEFEDKTKLFSPVDLTVTTTGEVVVLEVVSHKLKVYGRDGAHLFTLDLGEMWNRRPNYPSGVKADADGGVVVHDFNGKPSVVRMALDGTVVAQFTPAFPDGRAFDLRGHVQAGPDGRLWTSDGHALLRLDTSGVVDRVLGEKPDAETLGGVAALAVDAKGWIYAADERTGVVHVFDETGERSHLCRPDPKDYEGRLMLPSLAVSDAGDVYITRTKFALGKELDFLHYSPKGERVGCESVALGEVSQSWVCQPKTGNRWVVGYKSAFLVDSHGKTERKLDRTADGQWLENPSPGASAPDGSIVIASGAGPRDGFFGMSRSLVITHFARNGDAIATWPAPEGLLTWSGIGFDGTRVACIVASKQDASGDGKATMSVVGTDTRGKPLFRFTPPRERELQRVFLVPEGMSSELWLFDGKRTIDRYALP